MSEIKSATEVVEVYVAEIKSANDDLANDSVSITEDGETTLKVNENSTLLNASVKEAIGSITSQIYTDCGRIYSIASLFDENDSELAGGLLDDLC